jgi:thiamine transport system ATP-binding protein
VTSTALDVERLTVRYGTVTAVDDLTLSVSAGEVVALLGPSGCGKSTLLRAVAGLETPDTGAIRWAGVELTDVPVHRRGFGLMFQDGQLFPHRSVASNVAFGLRMAGVDKPTQARRTAELLELVGLAGYGRRDVATLSGGEQQRVALARSLAPEPRLLLLDEPLSSLDRALRERLGADLRDILTTTGTTALYVTHDQDEAFSVADRVGVMVAGRLLQVDSPQRLWQHPVDESVARFLGYRQLVDAEPLRTALGVDQAGPLLVALRPESFRVDPNGAFVGRILDSRVSRAGATLRVDVDGLGPVDARQSGAPLSGCTSPGRLVRLRIVPEELAVLPAADAPGQSAFWGCR